MRCIYRVAFIASSGTLHSKWHHRQRRSSQVLRYYLRCSMYLLAPFGRPAEGRSVSACTHACGIAWQIRSVVQNGVVHERVKLVRDDCLATVPGGLRPQRDCRAGWDTFINQEGILGRIKYSCCLQEQKLPLMNKGIVFSLYALAAQPNHEGWANIFTYGLKTSLGWKTSRFHKALVVFACRYMFEGQTMWK